MEFKELLIRRYNEVNKQRYIFKEYGEILGKLKNEFGVTSFKKSDNDIASTKLPELKKIYNAGTTKLEKEIVKISNNASLKPEQRQARADIVLDDIKIEIKEKLVKEFTGLFEMSTGLTQGINGLSKEDKMVYLLFIKSNGSIDFINNEINLINQQISQLKLVTIGSNKEAIKKLDTYLRSCQHLKSDLENIEGTPVYDYITSKNDENGIFDLHKKNSNEMGFDYLSFKQSELEMYKNVYDPESMVFKRLYSVTKEPVVDLDEPEDDLDEPEVDLDEAAIDAEQLVTELEAILLNDIQTGTDIVDAVKIQEAQNKVNEEEAAGKDVIKLNERIKIVKEALIVKNKVIVVENAIVRTQDDKDALLVEINKISDEHAGPEFKKALTERVNHMTLGVQKEQLSYKKGDGLIGRTLTSIGHGFLKATGINKYLLSERRQEKLVEKYNDSLGAAGNTKRANRLEKKISNVCNPSNVKLYWNHEKLNNLNYKLQKMTPTSKRITKVAEKVVDLRDNFTEQARDFYESPEFSTVISTMDDIRVMTWIDRVADFIFTSNDPEQDFNTLHAYVHAIATSTTLEDETKQYCIDVYKKCNHYVEDIIANPSKLGTQAYSSSNKR